MTDGRLAENFLSPVFKSELAEKRTAQYASPQRNFVSVL
jgi:hypothetical protein